MAEDDWARIDAIARTTVDQHGGAVKLSALIDAGVTGKQAAALTGRGVLDRPRNGWYVDPALPWEAKHAVRVGGVLACLSAVDSFGLPVPEGSSRRIHVLVPSNSARRRHHRSKRLYVVPGQDREVELHWSNDPGTRCGWRVTVVEALLQLADCVPLEWWIAALDAARHVPRNGGPMLSDAEWVEFVSRVPRRLKHALALVDARAESVIESLLRVALVLRGIPVVDVQFWPDRDHRVDLLLPGRLIVEADGAEFHDPELDALRDAILRGLGYRVLHFPYRRIVDDIEGVLAEIEAALVA